jgi:hypothetical protein
VTGVHHSARHVLRDILNVELGVLEVETLRKRWPIRWVFAMMMVVVTCFAAAAAAAEDHVEETRGKRMEGGCHLSRYPRSSSSSSSSPSSSSTILVLYEQGLNRGVVTCYVKLFDSELVSHGFTTSWHALGTFLANWLSNYKGTFSLSYGFARWHTLSQRSET